MGTFYFHLIEPKQGHSLGSLFITWIPNRPESMLSFGRTLGWDNSHDLRKIGGFGAFNSGNTIKC